jgi:hypothetical protein
MRELLREPLDCRQLATLLIGMGVPAPPLPQVSRSFTTAAINALGRREYERLQRSCTTSRQLANVLIARGVPPGPRARVAANHWDAAVRDLGFGQAMDLKIMSDTDRELTNLLLANGVPVPRAQQQVVVLGGRSVLDPHRPGPFGHQDMGPGAGGYGGQQVVAVIGAPPNHHQASMEAHHAARILRRDADRAELELHRRLNRGGFYSLN